MEKTPAERKPIEELLDLAGIRIDGGRPFDIQVRNPEFYPRVLAGGSLALGESYMDGWWDCQALDQFFERVMAARLDKKVTRNKSLLWAALKARWKSRANPSRAFEIGEHHYDLGNDLFKIMLDRRMNYSCAWWSNAEDLDAAQEAKLDLTCRKLMLKPGMRVLDIGCGWGGFILYAAEHFDVEATGITVSREQVDHVRQSAGDLPVRIELMDYRDIEGNFDRVISIGMFEHVCVENYPVFMDVVHRCLADEGLFLLHTIGRTESARDVDPWISKYIFPNSMLPSVAQIAAAAEKRLFLEDWHCFGPHYDRTLMAWYDNFRQNWETLRRRYDERFFRMWSYYLLSCAGSFRARRLQLWQILFSKYGLPGGCPWVR
ncbi:MAG: cyclopropane fatty acyl phospholipid synthase [Desulfobacterales bacterium]|nr:cyclopropane fatty acyl phospholipid synthase [Desulfobacterales bacterium]